MIWFELCFHVNLRRYIAAHGNLTKLAKACAVAAAACALAFALPAVASLVSGLAPQLGQFKWALAAWAALAMAGRKFFAGLADQFVYGSAEAGSHTRSLVRLT